MNLSFIASKPKYIFAKITKIWFFYIILSLVILFGFMSLLKYQIFLSKARVNDYQEKQAFYHTQIGKIDAYEERILLESELAKDRAVHNLMIRDAVVNLFNIIPDQITISYIEIGNDSLSMKGSTPSKEVFNFLLQDPLKAIFGKSSVTFFALSSGWYNFVSLSKSKTSIIESPKPKETQR
ncbi:hypothetical protein [Helicobacter cappadocius]|uniref:Uncharacterized protein n=1 Tax=Helicobacter cappadocius TaxID=3063998 RepID=A0AA90PJ65_9HELI|nr:MULTISPECIES: hypothetical protein [unclassified Helicobacter]MDO7252312.1 hypothetical protein [Helicobacter sp. faydin-H75]MDP2538179.1 hypothetical protein [Helicobacter sp. faydin-H76]